MKRAWLVGGKLGNPFGRWGGNPRGAGDIWVMPDVRALAPKHFNYIVVRELPAVENAIRLLGDELSALPIVVEERIGRGPSDTPTPTQEWEPVWDGDPEAMVVGKRWEPWRSAMQGVRLAVESLMLHGFAAVYVVRGDMGVRELVVLDPDCVSRGGTQGMVTFNYGGPMLEGVPNELERENLIFIEWIPELDRTTQPRSVFERAWPTIRAGIAVTRFNAWYFNRAALPFIWLVNDDPNSTDDIKKMQKTFGEGLDRMRARGRREFPMPRGWKPMSVSANPRESQMDLRLREATIAVSQLTGIPPVLLQDLDKATYSNFNQAMRYFSRFTLQSWARKLADVISAVVWPSGMRRMRFDIDDPGDEARVDTANRLQTEVNAGVRTQNEAREVLGLDPHENEQADELARTPTLPVPSILGVPDVGGDNVAPPDDELPDVEIPSDMMVEGP